MFRHLWIDHAHCYAGLHGFRNGRGCGLHCTDFRSTQPTAQDPLHLGSGVGLGQVVIHARGQAMVSVPLHGVAVNAATGS